MPDVARLWRHVWPALLVLVPGMFGTAPATANQLDWSREPDAFTYSLVVFAGLSVLVQRRWPGVTLVCCGAAVITYLLTGHAYGPMLFAVPVAAFGVAEAWPLRRALLSNGGLGLAVFAAGGFHFGTDLADGHAFNLLGWFGISLAAVAVPTAIGAAIRIRRESQANVRGAEARRAVSEERLRMAQELHDSVGHGLAVIAMQAGVALHVLESNPDKAREALEAIRSTSRESLDGLRSELDILRAPEGTNAPRRPGVGLADVDVLLERVRAGGVDVVADLRVSSLPPEADVAVYRILQEALTNVLRHANATSAWVRVARAGADVVIEIIDDGGARRAASDADDTANDGRAQRPPQAEHRIDDGGERQVEHHGAGIPGMRARVEALGGELRAGRRKEGGFAVSARFPIVGSGREAPVDDVSSPSVTGSSP
ncbi:sensor histidine kinase [Phytoactinopolyspora halophila]|uniref:sensor histidine kinase n=1 Tax=Phytoactinopolyspora halophila TaxID=1981511 RepID=UPI001FEBE688|nr:sensor histidine kinase [Phytoactinopolyspora halophila]